MTRDPRWRLQKEPFPAKVGMDRIFMNNQLEYRLFVWGTENQFETLCGQRATIIRDCKIRNGTQLSNIS